ncbi:GNAT family N-acetyltransferase [uncultured Aquimonas sp.]|uniref:GNAT family N-acetyltransferase n=1 Tax=uncultured Aquimonas sp. TaxID=385483 RepID=UPI00086E8E03|nr:GNAT family N-acetyltransferase [uncultured Aquimonas sp.]ODU40914.1 MAG: GNAT family N-acetyltransferase [Xanthomonadaceae bacterium SCN 69-123]
MSDLTLRAADPRDLDVLVEFNAAMAMETEALSLDRERLRAGVAALLADPAKGRYRLAERAGEVVGALMLTREWSDWRCGDWWWIQSVYVRADARRAGVFRALFDSVTVEARADAGVCGLRLYVERDNLRAQATYRALGMDETHYRLFEISTRS